MKNIKPLKLIDPKDEVKPVERVSEEKSNYLPIFEIPSKYKLYAEGTKILAKPLSVSEVKHLASMDETNYNDIINDVLKKTIKGIEVNNILVDDKYFLIFWLRANTYRNSGYEVDFYCPKCSKNSKYNFDVNALDVIYLRDDFVLGEEKELPLSKDRISIRHKTIGDEIKLQDMMKRLENSAGKYDLELLDLASVLDTVNGEKLSLMQKYSYVVEKMHPEDFSFFVSYEKAFKFGVKDSIKAICNLCKEETPIGVSFRKEFFIPEYQF